MGKLEILSAPDSRLNKKAEPIESVDKNVRKLMDDMLETMYIDHGVGLAANQVGVLQRVIVIDLQNDDDKKRQKGFYPLFLANPTILEMSGDIVEDDEGCMSVPGQRILVARHQKVKVEFLDYHNKTQEIDAVGYLARAIQHEMDHLEGKLIFDYLSKLKRDVVLRKLLKIKRLSD